MAIDRALQQCPFILGVKFSSIRVVDLESLFLDRVDEVDGGTREVGRTHPVGDDAHAVVVIDDVPIEFAGVEVQLVTQAGAAARLDGDAQADVLAAFLSFDESTYLGDGDVGQDDALGNGSGFSHAGQYSSRSGITSAMSRRRGRQAPGVPPRSPVSHSGRSAPHGPPRCR